MAYVGRILHLFLLHGTVWHHGQFTWCRLWFLQLWMMMAVPSYPKAIKRTGSNKIVFRNKEPWVEARPYNHIRSQSSRDCNGRGGAGRSTPAWSTHWDQTASKRRNQTNGIYSLSCLSLNPFKIGLNWSCSQWTRSSLLASYCDTHCSGSKWGEKFMSSPKTWELSWISSSKLSLLVSLKTLVTVINLRT